jgi:hypothetical protein
MKKVPYFFCIVLIAFFAAGCASFEPGSLSSISAASSVYAVTKDSVSVVFRELSPQETKRLFDTELYESGYIAISASFSNRGTAPVEFFPDSIKQSAPIEEILKRTAFSPTTRLLVWSIPWALNLVSGMPIYYGILWPVIGIIDLNKAKTANGNRDEFFTTIMLKHTTLIQGQDISGVIFLRRGYTTPVKLTFSREPKNLLFDIYPTK